MPNVRLTIVNNSKQVRINPTSTTNGIRLSVSQQVRNVRLTIGTLLGAGSLSYAEDLPLQADGPDTFDPPSGQRVIYLPNATKRYRVFKAGMLIDKGKHYTRTTGANFITLTDAIGDISEDDTFTLCEY